MKKQKKQIQSTKKTFSATTVLLAIFAVVVVGISVYAVNSHAGTSSDAKASYVANFVTTELPGMLRTGEAYPVRISVKNITNRAWHSETNPVFLQFAHIDHQHFTKTWGKTKIPLSTNESVQPGQIADFIFDISATPNMDYGGEGEYSRYEFSWHLVNNEGRVISPESDRPEKVVLFHHIPVTPWTINDSGRWYLFTDSSTVDAPQKVKVGQEFTATVTMKNTGNAGWTRDQKVRLGERQDGQREKPIFFGRADLGADVTIQPDQTATFIIKAKAPPTPGVYPFQAGMLVEDVRWFGRLSDLKMIEVTN